MTFSQFFQLLNTKITNAPTTTSLECPNCWGIQQWDDEHQAVNFDLNKDTTFIGKARKGFIQRFTDRYVPQLRKRQRT